MNSKKKLTKQERIVRQRKRMLFFGILAIVAISGLVIFSSKSKAEQSKDVYKYYESYQVQPGDTLWSIADNYMTVENNDKEAYISEIMQINHMLDDNIEAGQYIVVSYYSYEVL